MELGNYRAYPGHHCVHLFDDDTEAKIILSFASENEAIDRDGGEELIIVRFPGMSSDEAVTEEELKARLIFPLVNG